MRRRKAPVREIMPDPVHGSKDFDEVHQQAYVGW